MIEGLNALLDQNREQDLKDQALMLQLEVVLMDLILRLSQLLVLECLVQVKFPKLQNIKKPQGSMANSLMLYL